MKWSILLGFLGIIFVSEAKAKFGDMRSEFSISSMSSDDYQEGKKATLTVFARKNDYSLQQGFTYNTYFGLSEKVLNGRVAYQAEQKTTFFLSYSLGKDAYASNLWGVGMGSSHQISDAVNLNLIVKRQIYRSSTNLTFILGSDLETPRGFLVIPRLYFGQTDFNSGKDDKTFSWFIKAIHHYSYYRPYISYGRGEEIDEVLGGLLTRSIRNQSYTAGANLWKGEFVSIGFFYKYTDLYSLDRSYSRYGLKITGSFK